MMRTAVIPGRKVNPRSSPFYGLGRYSSDTVSLLLPLVRLRANTARPAGVVILFLNPCLLLRFLCEGW